jgi:hypothetical protein
MRFDAQTTGTLAQFRILIGFMEGTNVRTTIFSRTTSTIVGGNTGNILSYQLTFNSQKEHIDWLPKLLTFATLGFALNAGT